MLMLIIKTYSIKKKYTAYFKMQENIKCKGKINLYIYNKRLIYK